VADQQEPARVFQFGVPGEQTNVRSLEVRENFRALAQTLYTTDPAFPANPRQGMFRVLDDPTALGNVKLQAWIGTAWQTILQNIQVGVPAPAKIIVASFQTPPGANPWIIDHNLGSKPFIQVYSSPAPFRLLSQVGFGDRRHVRFLGRMPTSGLAPGQVRNGLALPQNGDLLRTFAICEAPISGPVDFTIQFTLAGTPLTPEADIAVNSAQARGDEVAGAAIATGNGVFQAGDALDIDAVVNTAPPDGALEVYAEINRTLQPDEYRVEHVNDNRIQVIFAQDTAGFAILVG